jgi:hypothetical protein
MFKGFACRLAIGAVAGVTTLAGGLVLGATTADAATSHAVKFSCSVPVVGTQAVTAKVKLTAPAKTTAGKTVKLSVQVQPTGLPAVAVTNLTVKTALTESGAQKGSVKLSEFLRSANSGNLKLNLTGRLKLTKAGRVRLTAGSTVTFTLTSSLIGRATVRCKATSKLPALGTISVGKAPRHSQRATAHPLLARTRS